MQQKLFNDDNNNKLNMKLTLYIGKRKDKKEYIYINKGKVLGKAYFPHI